MEQKKLIALRLGGFALGLIIALLVLLRGFLQGLPTPSVFWQAMLLLISFSLLGFIGANLLHQFLQPEGGNMMAEDVEKEEPVEEELAEDGPDTRDNKEEEDEKKDGNEEKEKAWQPVDLEEENIEEESG